MERHPSFTLSLSKGVYRCYSCDSRGFIVNLLHTLTGVAQATIRKQHTDLLKALITNTTQNIYEGGGQKAFVDAIFENDQVPESLLGLFHYCPVSLLEEGFEMETLQHFEVGFDEKHQRITYPIRDLAGGLIGISGRTVCNDNPRYKVYKSEYREFNVPVVHTNKGSTVWNGHDVFVERYTTSKDNYIVVVEGFKACMKVWQAGIRNVVALLGASMTDQQRWFFDRMGYDTILMLDNNPAGRQGQERIALSLSRSLMVRVAFYEREQPSDCSSEEIRRAVSNSDFYALQKIKQLREKYTNE
jgi:DNA primase